MQQQQQQQQQHINKISAKIDKSLKNYIYWVYQESRPSALGPQIEYQI